MLSLWTSKSLIGPQGIYQLWKCWLQLTMLEHQPRGGGVRQPEGAPSPRGRELPLGPNSGARILIYSFVLCDLWQIT